MNHRFVLNQQVIYRYTSPITCLIPIDRHVTGNTTLLWKACTNKEANKKPMSTTRCSRVAVGPLNVIDDALVSTLQCSFDDRLQIQRQVIMLSFIITAIAGLYLFTTALDNIILLVV